MDAANAKFTVRMVVPSVLEDLSRLEAVQTFVDVAERLVSLGEHLQLDPDAWREYVMKSVLSMSTDDIDKYISHPGIQPLPPLPEPAEPTGDTDTLDPIDTQDTSKQLLEKVKRALEQRLKTGSSSSRRVTERVRDDELPTEKHRSAFAFYQGELVPIVMQEDSDESDSE
jgi:hypothetical protein